MSFLERIGELTKAVLTTDVELKQQRQMITETQADVRRLRETIEQLSKDLHKEVQELRERVARLEAMREADRAELRAEVARFKAEVERATLQLERQHYQLPPSSEQRGDA